MVGGWLVGCRGLVGWLVGWLLVLGGTQSVVGCRWFATQSVVRHTVGGWFAVYYTANGGSCVVHGRWSVWVTAGGSHALCGTQRRWVDGWVPVGEGVPRYLWALSQLRDHWTPKPFSTFQIFLEFSNFSGIFEFFENFQLFLEFANFQRIFELFKFQVFRFLLIFKYTYLVLHALISAILYLAPHVGPNQARHYANAIWFEARWYRVDPFLVVALAHAESGFVRTARSKSHDYGLMQIHVTPGTRFHGHRRLLFLHRFNIREGTRLLAMWRNYHSSRCKTKRRIRSKTRSRIRSDHPYWTKPRSGHPYWAHYKWGRRVKTRAYALRVGRIYRSVLKFKLGRKRKRRRKKR